jgi:glycosyltransferase involved in cell wall biosynthesis
MRTFSIVIPTFRRPDSLVTAVRSWLAVDFPSSDFEIIVVDDDGRGLARRVVIHACSGSPVDLRFVEGDRTGAASARNLGAARASGRILVFADDDIIVRPDHLEQQLRTRELCGAPCVTTGTWEYAPTLADTLVSYSFGRLLLKRAAAQFQSCQAGDRHIADRCWTTDWADSCNLSVERRLFEGLGGFPLSGAGADYMRDWAFAWLAQQRGARLIHNEDLCLESHESCITLRQFCNRQKHVAAAAVILAARMPDEFVEKYLLPFVTANGPVLPSDSAATRLKKRARAALSRTRPLALSLRVMGLAERLRLPDRFLHPCFDRVVGLHVVRGMRAAGRSLGNTPASPIAARDSQAHDVTAEIA